MTDREELIELIKTKKIKPYIGGIYDGKINSYYKKNNVTFIPLVASRNNTNPIKEIKSIISVRKQIKKEKIDAVIIYGVKNHSAMAIGSKLGGAKKILCIVNGSGNLFRLDGIKGTIVRLMAFPMLKIAYAISSSICFQNNDDLLLFRKKKLILKKSDVFVTGGSGVNIDKFKPTKLPKENKFLFLARITSTKGIKEYIEAAYIMKDKYDDCTFDIYGNIDTTVEKDIEKIIHKAVKDKVVIYHGKTDDVAKAMKECRFFIYPSYYPEGISRCLLQALSSGRPIITCNTPGCKETVEDGKNGFLIEKQNVSDLVCKIEWFINNSRLVDKFGLESRKIAESQFDVNCINDIILSKITN